MLISIIVPYRDSCHFLPGLINNLQQQTCVNWECLLVDHCSVDGGGLLARKLTKSDSRFRCLAVPCIPENAVRRPAIPRNFALDHVLGQLVCFLDVDDRWHPEKLERQLKFHRHHSLDLSVTAYGRVHAVRMPGITERCPPFILSRSHLLLFNSVPMLTVMINASIVNPRAFDRRIRFSVVPHEDYVMWLRLWRLMPCLRYGCLPDLLAMHQRHGNNLSAQRPKMLIWLYRVYRSDRRPPLLAVVLAVTCSTLQLLRTVAETLGWRRLPLTNEQLAQYGLMVT